MKKKNFLITLVLMLIFSVSVFTTQLSITNHKVCINTNTSTLSSPGNPPVIWPS